MIAIDAGFLFGLVDRSDRWHARCVALLGTQSEGWVTTWPVLAEATYLYAKRLGAAYASALMDDVAGGSIDVWDPPRSVYTRLPVLMRKYAGLPMDLADASLVAASEALGIARIFSLDHHFRIYRALGTRSLEVIP